MSNLNYDTDATPQARAARNFAEHGGSKMALGRTLGWLGGCWCGQPQGHDWPGRAEGAPHPREFEKGS
jgi:hypothetical protein